MGATGARTSQPAARYRVRAARTPDEVARVLALRTRCFRPAQGAAPTGDPTPDLNRDPTPHPDPERDRDTFDAICTHYMVTETDGDRLVAAFRVLFLEDARALPRSYAAQHYDLSALDAFEGPMVELGRFCTLPDLRDPDILRSAWAELTRLVDANGVRLLFGCSSFHGTEAAAHQDAFALLTARHIAPRRWLPRVKAPDVVRFGAALRGLRPDMKRALAAMPPLLRSYLTMGGWVSDHAVVDRDLGTMHVFTGLEIGAIPAARKRVLRAVATSGA